jgi:hypothetical protein
MIRALLVVVVHRYEGHPPLAYPVSNPTGSDGDPTFGTAPRDVSPSLDRLVSSLSATAPHETTWDTTAETLISVLACGAM